jgi:hypothetical protein
MNTDEWELRLWCERQGRETRHKLRWQSDAQGAAKNPACTCMECPPGEGNKPWPASAELRAAGAPSHVLTL